MLKTDTNCDSCASELKWSLVECVQHLFSPQNISKRTDHGIPAPIQHMGIDLCGANILVPQLFLYHAYIHAALQQMCSKAMT